MICFVDDGVGVCVGVGVGLGKQSTPVSLTSIAPNNEYGVDNELTITL